MRYRLYLGLLSFRYPMESMALALAFSGRFARAGRAWLMSVETAFIQGFVVWIDFFFGSIRTCWPWFCTWLVLDCNGMHFCSLDI